MLTKIYCVLTPAGRIRYHGPSILMTASALEPGCIYGWGENYESSLADARRRLEEIG